MPNGHSKLHNDTTRLEHDKSVEMSYCMDDEFISGSTSVLCDLSNASQYFHNQHRSQLCYIFAVTSALRSAIRKYAEHHKIEKLRGIEYDRKSYNTMVRIFANCIYNKSLDGVVKNARLDYTVIQTQPGNVLDVIEDIVCNITYQNEYVTVINVE